MNDRIEKEAFRNFVNSKSKLSKIIKLVLLSLFE